MGNIETSGQGNNEATVEQDTKEVHISEKERDLVLKDPEYVGINFDQDNIVDGRYFWSLDRSLAYVKQDKERNTEEFRSSLGGLQGFLLEKRNKEIEKIEIFNKKLESFRGKLKHVRVHPAGELSPLTPSQAIETNSDGTFDVIISPEFINQVKSIKEQVKGDLTLVVQFYDYRRGKEKCSNVPETDEQVEQYIAICEETIENVGDDVQLEIGNETNVSRSTGPMFENVLQHTTNVNPSEYAQFFFKVAKRIKEKTPSVKLSVAGVACFDPTYLREVLTEVRQLQTEYNVNIPLVDTISFHPYRKDPKSGSVEVKNGQFVNTELTYKEQVEEMKRIASDFGVHMNVGEINFSFSDSKQGEKLEEAIDLTKQEGLVSYIYPGVNVA